MLKELHVENLALIQQATIDWGQGLNALTGETGAGKSMVIDAMGLLLGGRAQQEYIRSGSAQCLVEGRFLGPFPAGIVEDLAEAGISCEDELIFTRELQRSSKSVCRINLRSVPLAFYRGIVSRLVNIHGQMEHMNILEPWCQLALLDSYGGAPIVAATEKVSHAYGKWSQAKQNLAEFEKNQEELTAKSEFLHWQLQEIEKTNLIPGEEESLKQEQYRLDHAAAIVKSVQSAQEALRDNRGGSSALDRIWEVKCQIEKLSRSDDHLEDLLQQVTEAYYNLEDAAEQIHGYGDHIVDDPARLEWVNQRLATIRDVCRKHGGSIELALAEAEKYRQELDQVENKDYYGKELSLALTQATEAYYSAAETLTALRKQAAGKLGVAITKELQGLCMPDAVFSVEVTAGSPSASGVDEAVFMICPNPGEGVKPVAKIASGGEMSRIMLAVKVILAQMDQVPTLIFDEIDSGLGGVALGSVAKKLAEVSRYTQTICVTHAPVVAAYGDQHLLVEKTGDGGRTNTFVRQLSREERVDELCRMLAGENITEATKKQAQELLSLKEQLEKTART